MVERNCEEPQNQNGTRTQSDFQQGNQAAPEEDRRFLQPMFKRGNVSRQMETPDTPSPG